MTTFHLLMLASSLTMIGMMIVLLLLVRRLMESATTMQSAAHGLFSALLRAKLITSGPGLLGEEIAPTSSASRQSASD